MITAAAARARLDCPPDARSTVRTQAQLERDGWTPAAVKAQLAARRWQRIGRAIIRHNGPPTVAEKRRAAILVPGPRAALTSFTAAEIWGLDGWEREEIHVLVPRGARVRRPPELALAVHYTDRWPEVRSASWRGLHRIAPAAVLAASSFESPRAGCGLLAAVVQQRRGDTKDLMDALAAAPRTRHRAALIRAVHDITQGAQALSEIDLSRLCRRYGLPMPTRQVVRREPDGRRRYVDAEWTRPDGRRVVVEVDGALHLIAKRWWDDQLRQNELAIGGDIVLRFPTVVLRDEERLVAEQISRALGVPLGPLG